MKYRTSLTPVLFALILACHSSSGFEPASEPHVDASHPESHDQMRQGPSPANIIFFIADGTGSTHYTVLDNIEGRFSVLPRFTYTGMVRTHSASSPVTDSAASATAYATGHKTQNRALSVSPTGESYETALEIAERRGFATGLATTSAFFDATPAAFGAHNISRYNHPQIIDQMLKSGVDLVISNGLAAFGKDERPELTDLAREHGFRLVTLPTDLEDAGPGKLLAVFPSGENDLEHPGAPLSKITRVAIERLSAQSGRFFVMIETEATDSASHGNDTDDVIEGLRSLNRAVARALDFAEKDGNTLVLLTGDHETGDFEIAENRSSTEMTLEWGTKSHTGQALPIFAYGPGAEKFTGWLDNTDVGKRLIELINR